MKIQAHTSLPDNLTREIIAGINSPAIATWTQPDKRSPRFVHTGQWEDKGYVEMITRQGHVEFNIVVTISQPASAGYILGRFVEILMVHFYFRFTKLEILP